MVVKRVKGSDKMLKYFQLFFVATVINYKFTSTWKQSIIINLIKNYYLCTQILMNKLKFTVNKISGIRIIFLRDSITSKLKTVLFLGRQSIFILLLFY